ncbi:hypothetical protein [Pseudalkalibacillus sp. JSM 102089]|uniref:hypothetical protein n=1 Tax=Pseudalkalibacillus sp. JSM 102089 TaxID=3229856 RepID=UPI0035261C6E
MKDKESIKPTGWENIDKLLLETEQAIKEYETTKQQWDQIQKKQRHSRSTLKVQLKRTKRKNS